VRRTLAQKYFRIITVFALPLQFVSRALELTVTWRDEKVVSKGCRAADANVGPEVKLFIIDSKVNFQLLVGHKVAAVRWDATECHDLRASVKAKDAHFFVEGVEGLLEGKT